MNKLSWGLIGCGDIARKRIAPALRDLENCELVAVSRARAELAASFAQEFGARRHYANWQDLLNDDAVQAVYIATPVNLHAAQSIAAAEAGKHVLCEKPLAINAAECDRMIAAARAHGVNLGVAYYRRFYPVIERAKQLIAAGEIGQPVLAQINAFEFFNPVSDHPRSWLLHKQRSGGGPMFDFGCHRIEVFANLLGPITEVKAQTANVVFAREVEDTATALFRFESGACGVLSVTHAAREAQDTLDIFGSQGSLHISNLNAGWLRVLSGEAQREEQHPPAANLHAPLIHDFAEAAINGREPAVNGETGRMVALLEEEIYGQG
ncbi:MAG TPA: Gfo/Idh/MocA family oxidoreductase [Pyrinomonadaceae bacterium]|nr:Gfo/Idh/MocA family oxidoreductase [Pyrinomonadaceae bacterium]